MVCSKCNTEMFMYKDAMTKRIWYICSKCGKTILYEGGLDE